jgi:prepilin-type processing-associated H-X9-DG protein
MATEPQREDNQQPPAMRPHNGWLILGLGLAAFVLSLTCLFSPIAIILGIVAWIEGAFDLRGMKRGEIDSRGYNKAAVGRILGVMGILISSALLLYAYDKNLFNYHPGVPTCISNTKQLANAMLLYANDYDGHLPQAANWPQAMHPYTRNDRLLKCPEDKSSAKCSYAMNAALSGKDSYALENSAEVVILFEVAHPGQSGGGPRDVIRPGRHKEGRHYLFSWLGRRGSNYAFADGHARWYEDGEAVNFVPEWK